MDNNVYYFLVLILKRIEAWWSQLHKWSADRWIEFFKVFMNNIALVCCIIIISVRYFRDSRTMVTSMKLAQFICRL